MGTFRAHRWLASGADRGRIAEMRQARDEIAKAIEINPDAHFGRERVQLRAMEWIIKPEATTSEFEDVATIPLFRSGDGDKPEERARGLAGLIVLGNAWESVDIFSALAESLSRSRNAAVAYLAKLRCRELIDQGRRSLMPDAPKKAEELKQFLGVHFTLSTHQNEVEKAFAKLRAEAEQWHKGRTEYMMARLQTGRHPDTDPAFWKDYRDAGPPSVALPWHQEWLASQDILVGIFVGVAFCVGGGILLVYLLRSVLHSLIRKARGAGGRRWWTDQPPR